MTGSPKLPFFNLFLDTVMEHGCAFAMNYYMGKHRMTHWEFMFWMTQCAKKINLVWAK